MLLLYFIERVQTALMPWNPQNLPTCRPDLAFNTAASFTTNTNWQSYCRREHDELSHPDGRPRVSQLRFRRGRHRACHRVDSRHRAPRNEDDRQFLGRHDALLSLGPAARAAFVVALLLVSQGVVQNFKPYDTAQLSNHKQSQTARTPMAKPPTQTVTQQTIARPCRLAGSHQDVRHQRRRLLQHQQRASLRESDAVHEFLEMILIFAIPAGLTYTLGRMTGSPRHGWAVWSAMAHSLPRRCLRRLRGRIARQSLAARQSISTSAPLQSGGNMEGKEVRFGVANSALFATVTTDASCGAVNSMHDSFTPLGGMVPLLNIMLGEVIFGGVGSGLYGMIVFVILAVFIAGLMVGRTPEYLGKKIEVYDVKMAMLVSADLSACQS